MTQFVRHAFISLNAWRTSPKLPKDVCWCLVLFENTVIPYLFQAHSRGGGGLFERGGLFSLERTMVSVRLHKEVEYGGEKLKCKKFRSWNRGSVSHPNFQLVNKPSRISPHEILQSWLISTVYNLLVKNNWEREGGLDREGALINFVPLKRGGGLIRGRGQVGGGGGLT